MFTGQKGSLIAASYENDCAKSGGQFERGNRSISAIVQKLIPKACCQTLGMDSIDEGAIVCQCFNLRTQHMWSYHDINCDYLFSSIKDYLILQSALMGVGAGVSLWFWKLLTDHKHKSSNAADPGKEYLLSNNSKKPDGRVILSFESKQSSGETNESTKSSGFSRQNSDDTPDIVETELHQMDNGDTRFNQRPRESIDSPTKYLVLASPPKVLLRNGLKQISSSPMMMMNHNVNNNTSYVSIDRDCIAPGGERPCPGHKNALTPKKMHIEAQSPTSSLVFF